MINCSPVPRLAYPLNKNTTKNTFYYTNLFENTTSSISHSKSTSTSASKNFTSSYDQVKNIPLPSKNMPNKVKDNSTTSFASLPDEILKFKNTIDHQVQLVNTSSSQLKNIFLSTDLGDQEEKIISLIDRKLRQKMGIK